MLRQTSEENNMKRCNGCFENLRDDLDICPFCGYYDGSSGDPDYLLPGTMLSGRYQIGNLLDYDGTNATYIALDTNADKKVEIKEFFPNDCATRGSDGSVNPREDHKSVFDEGFQGFVEEAKRLFGNGGAVKVYDCVFQLIFVFLFYEFPRSICGYWQPCVPQAIGALPDFVCVFF